MQRFPCYHQNWCRIWIFSLDVILLLVARRSTFKEVKVRNGKIVSIDTAALWSDISYCVHDWSRFIGRTWRDHEHHPQRVYSSFVLIWCYSWIAHWYSFHLNKDHSQELGSIMRCVFFFPDHHHHHGHHHRRVYRWVPLIWCDCWIEEWESEFHC